MPEIIKTLIPIICSILVAAGSLVVAYLEKKKRKFTEKKHKHEQIAHKNTKIKVIILQKKLKANNEELFNLKKNKKK